MQSLIINIVVFILVFGVIVAIHEYGHLFWAKRSGILVREYAIGMGPKIFAHRGKDGTLYTIRILPVGGYVRMAGWGDDSTEIKKGTPAGLVLVDDKVTRINLSEHIELNDALPIFVTDYDFDDALTISGEVSGEEKTFQVAHDATVIEEDGTELLIAPRDVQYQSASIPGKLITNFGGPLNNFILGLLVFIVMVFVQGGVASNSNQIGKIEANSAAQTAGLKQGDIITAVGGKSVSNWTELVSDISSNGSKEVVLNITRDGQQKEVKVTPQKTADGYKIGFYQHIKTGFWDKITGGFQMALSVTTLIFQALGHLFTHPSLNQLGGPVAIFQATGTAAKQGLVGVLYFLAMLSINLGIVNLIPIPALDGGKILINLIEAVRGKPMKQENESIVTMVGVVFMLLLFVAVTWNDIMRFFVH